MLLKPNCLKKDKKNKINKISYQVKLIIAQGDSKLMKIFNKILNFSKNNLLK